MTAIAGRGIPKRSDRSLREIGRDHTGMGGDPVNAELETVRARCEEALALERTWLAVSVTPAGRADHPVRRVLQLPLFYP